MGLKVREHLFSDLDTNHMIYVRIVRHLLLIVYWFRFENKENLLKVVLSEKETTKVNRLIEDLPPADSQLQKRQTVWREQH